MSSIENNYLIPACFGFANLGKLTFIQRPLRCRGRGASPRRIHPKPVRWVSEQVAAPRQILSRGSGGWCFPEAGNP